MRHGLSRVMGGTTCAPHPLSPSEGGVDNSTPRVTISDPWTMKIDVSTNVGEFYGLTVGR
jgi:hypothetical protein